MKIARGEQEELSEKLTKNGVLFNEDGTVKNYAEAIKAQEAYVNSLIDKYNKMSKTQQESYKETIEQAEKDFDKFKTNIDRYDELVSDFIPQLQQNIQDSIDKQIELNVKKFNLEIDVTLNLNQATRD
jgi:multidrug resistance efflux pump